MTKAELYQKACMLPLLPALTEEKPKLWCSILAGAGMGSACYNIRKARRIREEKQNHEHDEEE